MTEEKSVATAQASGIIKFNVTDAAIEKMKSEFLPLKITALDDKAGYARCKEARKIVKDTRLGVERHRKDLKEEALRWGQKVDTEAKRITSQLVEVEDHLAKQLDYVDGEIERQRLAREAADKARFEARISRLQAVRAEFSLDKIKVMAEEEFNDLILRETKRFNDEKAEADRLAKELAESKQREKEERERREAAEKDAQKAKDELIASQNREREEKEAAAKREKEAAEKAEAERKAQEKARADEAAAREAQLIKEKEAAEAATRAAQDKAEADKLAAEDAARKEKEAAEEAAREEREAIEAKARRDAQDMEIFNRQKELYPNIGSAWLALTGIKSELAKFNEQVEASLVEATGDRRAVLEDVNHWLIALIAINDGVK